MVEPSEKSNIYLLPSVLFDYQKMLTKMLEAEQYIEAKQLLRFLVTCHGEDKKAYDEWNNLLAWLEMAFPLDIDPIDDEQFMRDAALNSHEEEAYADQVMYIIKNHPIAEQQMLALDRAVHIQHPELNDFIVIWLTECEIHPELQFRALQCLRKRGARGKLPLWRLEEEVIVDIAQTPLSMDEFAHGAKQVVEQVIAVAEQNDETMVHFAGELWRQYIQCLYGTEIYQHLVQGDQQAITCFAAALHQRLELALYGQSDDEKVRHTYGITEQMRFFYEQCCRLLKKLSRISTEFST